MFGKVNASVWLLFDIFVAADTTQGLIREGEIVEQSNNAASKKLVVIHEEPKRDHHPVMGKEPSDITAGTQVKCGNSQS